MEKNQQDSGAGKEQSQEQHHFSGNQPGQQLPAGTQQEKRETDVSEKKEQHSESSFPQKDGETLGTP